MIGVAATAFSTRGALAHGLLQRIPAAYSYAQGGIMTIHQLLMAAPLTLLMCVELGCGSTREVAMKGEVASNATVEGPIAVQFFDLVDTQKPSLVHSIKLDTLAAFEEKASLQGNEVLIRAINDRNADGVCSAGEPWAEVRAPIKDDETVDAVSLDLTAAPCPAE
jgi:hypothetical protein